MHRCGKREHELKKKANNPQVQNQVTAKLRTRTEYPETNPRTALTPYIKGSCVSSAVPLRPHVYSAPYGCAGSWSNSSPDSGSSYACVSPSSISPSSTPRSPRLSSASTNGPGCPMTGLAFFFLPLLPLLPNLPLVCAAPETPMVPFPGFHFPTFWTFGDLGGFGGRRISEAFRF